MREEEKNVEVEEEEELSLDDLAEVSGGAGLRRTKKVETVDISDDTRAKI